MVIGSVEAEDLTGFAPVFIRDAGVATPANAAASDVAPYSLLTACSKIVLASWCKRSSSSFSNS